MATSLFFIPTDQNNPNELQRNTHHVNGSGEIRTEPQQKTRGRKPGSKTGQQNQKKPKRRGMGMAQLERIRIEGEKKKTAVAGGGDTSAITTRLPDPGVVLQGFPSYGGPTTASSFGSRLYCGGVGSGQIMIEPWGFVETPNIRYDTCFIKKRLDGDDQNVVRSNGGGFSKYTMIPPPMNGYDHLLPPDQRNQGFFYDHRLARSASASSNHPYFHEATNHTGLLDEFESGNPRNGTGDVKEYEFFPRKYDETDSVATSVGDCSPNISTIDLSLKL
ncbi:protein SPOROCYTELESS [Eutrema salsugineum]|uniref:protein SPOROCYTELESS n=1 Tax=Eutrema salsugineum TaxID=72664 RepID=UPI000CED4E4D|nr:protein SPOROCYTELESS [Eutrema salsugineum]